MSTTRRELGVLALGAALAGAEAHAGPRPAAPSTSVSPDETMARAIAFRDKHAAAVRAAAARLPAAVEPAFAFTPRGQP